MSFVSKTSVKRSSFKWACVFMGVVCLLLLAGNIYLAVQKTQDQSIWRSHKMQLEKNNSDYRNLTEQLTIINNKLKEKINTLSSKPSGPPCEVPSHVQAWTQWFDRDDPSGTGDWETIVDLRRENPGKICRDPVDIEAVTLSGLDASQTGENIYLNDLENGFVCRNQDQPDWECSDYKVRLSCAPDSCENVCWTK
ncbi:cartilage intermediate layer protein 2-like [Poecilia formosa]|uniref:cartilage intermediate layer protein 2-like n=1 Tax=Poecilia formosa TaxID=48698 RepID=UPI0007B7E1C3|nr:PREDICTED: cartilage intermediate layer protein 2-like [Poecilia formosa]